MPIPARLLRAYAEHLPGARHRATDQERDRETCILEAATTLMARFGRMDFTMGNFALALRFSPLTLRRHFPDADALLAEILYRHLAAIAAAIGQVPRDAANPNAARRRAYIAATRTPCNAPTERHLLLMRDRHVLPPDLLQPIESLRLQIGDMIAGAYAEAALALLDTVALQPDQIEAMLAGLDLRPAAAPPPPPARPAPDAPKSGVVVRLAPKLPPFPAMPPAPEAHARLMDLLARSSTLAPAAHIRDPPEESSPFLKKRTKKLLSIESAQHR